MTVSQNKQPTMTDCRGRLLSFVIYEALTNNYIS